MLTEAKHLTAPTAIIAGKGGVVPPAMNLDDHDAST
jgi:hypothetical protein